ncbi:MAG: MFS transporter [Muribaculaceae bacterium]|nr:MFS transporter [Muribaculaceae bacterium]
MPNRSLDIRKYVAIISIIILLVMTVLDVSLVNVALPVIGNEFNVSESSTVWLVTIYQLIIVMLLLPLASIGDQFSYRRNFIIGLVVFTIGSGLCAMSQNFTFLLISRGIQAIGGAGVMSVNVALTRIIYPRNILGRGLALNAMFISIATAAGPSLAGWIMSISTWHWLFLINLPFGILAFFIGIKTLPPNPNPPANPHLDWQGSFLNVLFFGMLFYSLGNITDPGLFYICLAMLAVALLVGFFYVRKEFRSQRPMFPIDLFRIRLYSTSILTSTSSFIAQNLTMIALPFLFLSVLKFSELNTGLVMTPWPLATMIVSPLAARWIEKHNAAFTAAFGMLIFMTGLITLVFVPIEANEWDIIWRMALCGIGFGFFQTPNNIVMVMATPVERTGAAGGMQSTARLTGQTFGSTLVSIIFALIVSVKLSVTVCLWIALFFAIIACIFSIDRGKQIIKRHVTLES